MKLIPSWFNKKPPAPGKAAPEPETVEQAEAKLQQARADLAVAERQVEEARVRLDNERTDEALGALRAAKTNAEDLAELVKLVEQDLEAANARAEAVRRAELERQHTAVLAQLQTRSETTSALERAEAEAWRAVVAARAERLQHANETLLIEQQATVLGRGLGLSASSNLGNRGWERTHAWHLKIAEELEAIDCTGEVFDLKRSLVRMLVPNFDNQPRV